MFNGIFQIMALSKPLNDSVREKLNCIDWYQNVTSTIPTQKILDVCKIAYHKAMSIEIIEHLLGGINMEYVPMELENSFDCLTIC